MQGADRTPVTVSAITLATMRDRVELVLQDSSNDRWAAGDIDEAITHSLEHYSRRDPNTAIGIITLTSDGREIDISSLTGLITVQRVWWDYDSTTPGHPPNWRHFETWPGSLIYVDDPGEPQNGDKVRIWYTKKHTINGLSGESVTTIPIDDETFLIEGAAGFAAQFRAIELAETLNTSDKVYTNLLEFANRQKTNFNKALRSRERINRVLTYDQDDIDEAIRWALHRYSQIKPDVTITPLTLAADGREIDISSITDYVEIQRVWWDYDSSDPAHPPNWRDFELWPGNVLYIDDPTEPTTGDVVRVWYTRLQAINGLDGASTTTIPNDDETLIVIGASGFVAQERVQEENRRSVPRKLREWADARLKEFERELEELATREGNQHGGIAPGPSLDRWDEEPDGWR